MAEKTIVEKAAEKVGYGIAMAEDVAGSVKAAVGAAVAVMTKSPEEAKSHVPTSNPTKPAAQGAAKKITATNSVKGVAPKKSAPQKSASQEPAPKKSQAKETIGRKSPAKKSALKASTAKKDVARKSPKKSVKATAKKSGARR